MTTVSSASRADESTSRLPSRRIACPCCNTQLVHVLCHRSDGAAWTCTACGGTTARYTHEDMRAMIEAYAGPLASAAGLPPKPVLSTQELASYEIDVQPANGEDLITYSGVALERHLNVTHALPVVGGSFWGHHPRLAPHVAKYELGVVRAVRRLP